MTTSMQQLNGEVKLDSRFTLLGLSVMQAICIPSSNREALPYPITTAASARCECQLHSQMLLWCNITFLGMLDVQASQMKQSSDVAFVAVSTLQGDYMKACWLKCWRMLARSRPA